MKKIRVSWRIKFPHVVYGNPFSPIAICIIYPYRYPGIGRDFSETDRKAYEKYIDLCKRLVRRGAAVAGLQNTELGILYVAETILSNPNIRWLIVVGKPGGHRIDLIYKKLSEGIYDESMRNYLSKNTFERLRKQIKIIDLIGYDPLEVEEELYKLIEAAFQENPTAVKVLGKTFVLYDPGAYSGKAEFQLVNQNLVILGNVVLLSVKNIEEAWKRVNSLVNLYGIELIDWRGKRIVLPYVLILSVDNPLDVGNLDEKVLEKYYEEFSSSDLGSRVYTYGNRLFSWFGLNQVEKAIEKLRKGYLTQGHIVLYDPRHDFSTSDVPCITELHIKVVENKVLMRATIRSWDVGRALPFNLYALGRLLEYIAGKLGKEINGLVVVADEPHVYI